MKLNKEDIQAILEDIALEELGLNTLEQRHCDDKDFKEVSVWGVKNALETAFKLGQSYSK